MKSLNKPHRKFSGKASAMLAGITAIVDSALDHVPALAEEDTSITEVTLIDLRRRIDRAIADILGADNAEGLRVAHETARSLTDAAAAELTSIKTFIETRYIRDDARRRSLLQNLGFTELFRTAVIRRQHEDMVELLARVTANLDAQLEAELVGAGLPGKRVETLRRLAASYHEHNVAPEKHLGRQRQYNAADTIVLNELYTEVMAIAKIAKAHFKNDPVVRMRFTYGRLAPAGGHKKDSPATGMGKSAA